MKKNEIIEKFVSDLTKEQSKKALIDCLWLLSEIEYISTWEYQEEDIEDFPGRKVGDVNVTWSNSGDDVA